MTLRSGRWFVAGLSALSLVMAVGCTGASPTATVPPPTATTAAPTATKAATTVPAPTATSAPAGTATAVPAPTATTAPTATPTSIPRAQRKGTVTVATPYGTESRLPLLASNNQALNPMYDPFFELGTENLATEGTFRLAPAAIKTFQVSNDWKTITFTLAQGVKAHDPKWGEYTADDFAYLINEYVPKYEKQMGLAWGTNGYTAKVTGPYQVEVTRKTGLRFSNSFLVVDLGQRVFAAPFQKQIQAEGLEQAAKDAVGTGPFRISSEGPGLRVFDRVPNHWRVDPQMDQLKMIMVPESSTRLSLVLAGQAQVGVEVEESDATRATQQALTVVTIPNTTLHYVLFGGMNTPDQRGQAPWVTDIRVRQAVALSIDVDTMIKQLYYGRANRMSTLYPSPASKNFKPYAYDPEKAKQLLKDAAYPANYEIKFPLVLAGGGKPRDPAEYDAVQIYLQKIGMKTKGFSVAGSGLFYSDWGKGNIDGHIWAFPYYGYAGGYLTMWQQMSQGVFSPYSDAKVKEYYAKLVDTESVDPAGYAKTEQEGLQYLYDNYYMVPLYTTGSPNIVAKDFVSWELPGYVQQDLRFDRLVFKP